MLEAGDHLDVYLPNGVDVGDVKISNYNDEPLAITSTDDNYDFLWLSGKKPYFINIAYIECVVGEWNKDRTQYGVRIFLRSGNSVWTADGADVLETLYGDDAAEFFKKVAAKGDD